MAQFKLSVQMPAAAAIMAEIYQRVLPHLSQAVGAVAQQVAADWVQAVQQAKLWEGEKDAYSASIKWEKTGPFKAVVSSDYRYAEEIETGRPARDLKKMLDTSLKVRVDKKGKRYLIIPFRHGTPGHSAMGSSMPPHVYAQARQLLPSKVVGRTERVSGTGAYPMKTPQLLRLQRRMPPGMANQISTNPLTVNQNIYKWGERLGAGSMGPNQKGKSDRFAGMVRFDTSSKKAKSSAYLTFRVMHEDSKGWIIPPRPGLYIVKQVVERMEPLAIKAFGEAVRRDIGA